jgi:hypothetical protein
MLPLPDGGTQAKNAVPGRRHRVTGRVSAGGSARAGRLRGGRPRTCHSLEARLPRCSGHVQDIPLQNQAPKRVPDHNGRPPREHLRCNSFRRFNCAPMQARALRGGCMGREQAQAVQQGRLYLPNHVTQIFGVRLLQQRPQHRQGLSMARQRADSCAEHRGMGQQWGVIAEWGASRRGS